MFNFGPALWCPIQNPNFLSVILQLHGDGVNNGTSFPDTSQYAWPVTTIVGTSGLPQTRTAAGAPVSGASAAILFDAVYGVTGSGGLSVAGNSVFDMGSGDFTIEYSTYFAGNPSANVEYHLCGSTDPNSAIASRIIIYFSHNTSAFTWRFVQGGAFVNLLFTFSGTPVYGGNGVWRRLCFMRKGNTAYFFVDGIFQSSVPMTGAIDAGMPIIYLGSENAPGFGQTAPLGGYMSEFRWSIRAQYPITGYTPATAPFPNF